MKPDFPAPVPRDIPRDRHKYEMTQSTELFWVEIEWEEVLSFIIRQVNGRIPVIAGTGGNNTRDVIEKAGYGAYFGHGFGHSLGLDIHEPPNAGPRGEALMAENDHCSAEPGIYLPGRFGVRIEDVMILRADGAEVITRAPKDELIIL